MEVADASENRLSKIVRIIKDCRLGIHDISRTELNEEKLPRFNMPMELGLFLGAKNFGGKQQQSKKCLIFDKETFRYQKFISDIAGQDVTSHQNDVRSAVIGVRNWLNTERAGMPSGSIIWEQYLEFREQIPALCAELTLVPNELTFPDYTRLIYGWLEDREKEP